MKNKKPSSVRRILLLLAAAILVAGAGYFVFVYFQVRHVVPAGNARFTSAYITALASVEEGTHMLQVDEEQIRGNIQNAEPYLQVMQIRLRMPDTVVIEVEERHPAALLPYNHQYLLVDINTDVLELVDDPNAVECPVVTGISVDSPQIGVPFETQDSFKVSVMQEILAELDSRNLFPLIASIDLTNINNIRMTSRDGLSIRIGQAERIGEKIKWVQNRLPALAREGQSSGTLDVSSGSFATYTMYDGSQSTSAAQPSASQSSSASEPSAQPSSEGSESPEEGDSSEEETSGDESSEEEEE